MDKSLAGKRILLIGQVFYDYQDRIIAEMESMGARVSFYENKLFREDPVIYPDNLISLVKRTLNPCYKSNYNRYILEQTQGSSFDILFCIGGFSLSLEFIEAIKKQNPGIKSIAYFWDAFSVWPFAHLLPAFDQVYTFERSDAERYNINYLPLFFSPPRQQYIPGIQERKFDLLYVGSVGPKSQNRFDLLAGIKNACAGSDIRYFLYLLFNVPQHNLLVKGVNKVRLIFDAAYRNFINKLNYYLEHEDFVKTRPLAANELNALLLDSKCVIDIQVPGQTGLTMRTIESLALGCKLLTTNMAINREPFYDPEWIWVIDDAQLLPPKAFIMHLPAKAVNIDYLSLNNWIKNILGNHGS